VSFLGGFCAVLVLVGGTVFSADCDPGACAQPPCCNGDANGDGAIELADAVYLLNYLFQGGPAPVAIADDGGLTEEMRRILDHFSLDPDDNLVISSEQGVKFDLKKDFEVSAGEDVWLDATGNLKTEAGMEVYSKAGTTNLIHGGVESAMKSGSNFICTTSSGTDVVGALVRINSGGTAPEGW
jgi:hypothetical protein